METSVDFVTAEVLSRLQLGGILHSLPSHRVYNRGLNRNISDLSSIQHLPRQLRNSNCNSQDSVDRRTLSGRTRRNRPPHSLGKTQTSRSHCNKPYTWEQTCWVRYYFEDLKKRWPEIEDLFSSTFKDLEIKRTKQGLQSTFYRQNKMLPSLDEETERYIGMPNGHIAFKGAKKKDQKNYREGFFTFVNLYPEWAVVYPWVSEEHRREASRLRTCSIALGTSYQANVHCSGPKKA